MSNVTLLSPYTVQRFVDNQGNALSGGLLTTYSAGTSVPIATYTDATGLMQNSNPITLNARGEASIWLLPNVGYKFALTDSSGNQVPGWPVDNIVNAALLSLYGGIDTGVANAYIINFASPLPPNTNGQFIIFLPANSNTGPSTINVNGGGPQPILNPNGSVLGANQILANQFVAIIEINGVWQLYGGSGVGVNVGTFGAEEVVASAATTDLGSVSGHNVCVTGTTTVTSFGTSAQLTAPIYIGRFTNSLILAQSSALILPGGNNITTNVGDAFIAEFMGNGNWRVLIYQYAGGASAQTVAVKAVDTAITSNATLTADPDLSVTLLTGQYQYELFMLFDSVAAGAGFKFSSNGTAVDSRATSPAVADGLVNAAAYGPKLESFVGSTITYATISTSADSNGVLYKGSLLVSTAGTFGVSWAQNSSNASATTLRAGSYLTANLLAQKTTTGPLIRIYTSPTTAFETIPAGYTNCFYEVDGASAGGGIRFISGGSVAGGGGGGSGGYSNGNFSVAGQGGKTVQYTVGALGGPDFNGGLSSISSGTLTITTVTANGGMAGGNAVNIATPGTGGAGGTATGGTVNTSGNPGAAGQSDAGGGGGGAGGAGIPGVNYGGARGGHGGGVAPPSAGSGGNGFVVFSYS